MRRSKTNGPFQGVGAACFVWRIGVRGMQCYSPLKGYKDPETGGIKFRRDGSPDSVKMEVRCGQCLGCRLHRSNVWMARIMHEASLYLDNCFVTLTYRERADCTREELRNGWYVPEDGSLRKKDFQKFMKRLRKRFAGSKVRYYQCGEYGEKLQRPHHHACLFNFDFSDKELFQDNDGVLLFTSKILEELWPYGFYTLGS